MMDFSKLSAGKLILASAPVHIDRLASEVTRLSKHLVKPSVKLGAHTTPGTVVLGSGFHLQQVLLNMVSNACKHTERGSVTIRVEDVGSSSADPSDHAAAGDGTNTTNRTIRFSVADTGVGIPLHKRASIFEEYEQASVFHAGTGLGLALCKALVKTMGSHITLECPESGGANFSFELSMPRVSPDGCGAGTPGFSASLDEGVADLNAGPCETLPAGLRVLVADDMRINSRLVARTLKKLLRKPDIIFAQSGEEALAMLTARPDPPIRLIDVAILDHHFGNDAELSTGLDVTRRAREANVKSSFGGPILIIGYSGNEGPAHNELALAAGQDAIWGKPLPQNADMVRDLQRLCCD